MDCLVAVVQERQACFVGGTSPVTTVNSARALHTVGGRSGIRVFKRAVALRDAVSREPMHESIGSMD